MYQEILSTIDSNSLYQNPPALSSYSFPDLNIFMTPPEILGVCRKMESEDFPCLLLHKKENK